MELYGEIICRKDFTQNRIAATLQFYDEHHEMGAVTIIELDGAMVGYAITFRFWSNEYSGLMLGVDELYIRKPFRRQGIASSFINKIVNDNRNDYVGIEMESYKGNELSAQFFSAIGLPENDKSFYIKLFRQEK